MIPIRFFKYFIIFLFANLLYAEDYNNQIGLQTGLSDTHFSGYEAFGLYGVRIFAEHDFLTNLGAEVGYTSYKTGVAGSNSVSESALDLLGLLKFHILDHIETYAKVGATYTYGAWNSASGRLETSGMSLAFALGVDYDLGEKVFTRVEWYRVLNTGLSFNHERGLPVADLYSLGLAYRF